MWLLVALSMLRGHSLRFADTKNGEALDATHWTVVAETDGKDDNRPATIRETTTRNGPKLVTLKEVDYSDDEKEEWLQRNRKFTVNWRQKEPCRFIISK